MDLVEEEERESALDFVVRPKRLEVLCQNASPILVDGSTSLHLSNRLSRNLCRDDAECCYDQ